MDNSIPIILITGFLGSGKTSFLNNLLGLDHIKEKKISLIINEFGKLGIDGSLVESNEYPLYEINKGSVFCICVKTDLIKTFKDIAENVKPDLVIIEATGIAQPGDIISLIKDSEADYKFRISSNICLVDSANFIKVLANLKSVKEQVKFADAVIINKEDLVLQGELNIVKELVNAINPSAKKVTASFGRVSPSFINNIKHRSEPADIISCPPPLVYAFSVESGKKTNKETFLKLLENYKNNILRLKGTVDFGSEKCFIEVAGKQVLLDNKKQYADHTKVSVIAWNMAEQELKNKFIEVCGVPEQV